MRRLITTCALLAIATSAGPAGAASPAGEQKVYSFGVVPQVPTAKLAKMWVPFLEAISARSGVRLEFVTAPSLEEFFQRSTAGKYDFYFNNPLAYVKQDATYTAFAKEANAKLFGILVARKDGPLQSLADLRGTSVAVPSAGSFAASVVTMFEVQRAGLALQKDVKVVVAGSHDAAMYGVLDGKYAAAGTNKRVFEQAPPALRDNLRVLHTTEGYTPLAFAARNDVPAEVVKRVQKAMIEFGRTPADKAMLEALAAKGFEAAKPSDWDDIRKFADGLGQASKAVAAKQ